MAMRTICGAILAGLVAAAMPLATARAQYESSNISLYKQFTLADFGNPSNGNDCWGYVSESGREYAIMGLANRVGFVEVTDPANARIITTISHNNSLWADIKVYQDYAYVVNESGGGVQVIDMSNIDNDVVTLVRSVSSPSTSHNLALNPDSGYLFPVGSNTDNGGLIMFSLAQPDNPVRVAAWNTSYVHDAHVVTYTSGPYAGKEIAFNFCGGNGIYIVDITNKSNLVTLSQKTYPCLNYCHQGWTSNDRRYLFVDDELDELYGCRGTTTTYVFDIQNLSNIQLVNTFTTGIGVPDHNQYFLNNLIFQSNYGSGLRVWDVSNIAGPAEIAYFDTYPGGNPLDFVGNWSNYPYFPSGTVIASDMQRGLFILNVAANHGGIEFNFPNGIPDRVLPAGGTTVRVEVVGSYGGDPQPGTGLLHYDLGGGFVSTGMNQISDNVYDAVFPAVACGDTVRFYFSAEDTEGAVYTDPANAPASSHSALSTGGTNPVFVDNFEADMGWTVSNENVSDGAWARGIPAGSGTRGDPTEDYDGSGRCFVTGLGEAQDLDGGPTRLISPAFDLSSGGLIEYAAWFANDDNDADRLTVEVSSNDGTNWTLVESLGQTSGWELHRFDVADYVTPSAQMRMRFSASDNPNNSVTEAGVDAFNAFTLVCEGGITCGDIKKLTGRCRDNGQIKSKVVLVDESFSGQTVTIAIDGVEHVLTISGRRAAYSECCFSGEHTVTLEDPAGCGRSKTVTCP